MSRPFNELTATEAADAIASGAVTSEQLVSACLDRIGERDGQLRAWNSVVREKALQEARALDKTPRRSPLHGLPVGVKDVIDTADYPTAYGSPIYAGHRPKADATCVALLKRAGCVVLGKTVSTEFANITPADTRNPHDLGRTPGGSSSGSAAAVADFMVPLALGTQTAGSTIRPAFYCGTFAIKPTFGLLSRVGVKALSESLDTIGLFARSASDLSLLLKVLSGRTAQQAPGRAPRIGVLRTGNWQLVDAEAAVAIEGAADGLKRQGADVFDLELAAIFDELADDHAIVMGYESARALAWEFDAHSNEISAPLSQRLKAGWGVTRQAYDAILSKAAVARIALARAFERCDFILTPSCAGEAPVFGSTGDSKFNRAWTLLGNPCVAVPLGKSASGLPLGLQIVGAMGSDMELLAWADWAETHLAKSKI